MHGQFHEHHIHAPSDVHGQFCRPLPPIPGGRLAVVATLSKGHDLDYIWKQVDRGFGAAGLANESGLNELSWGIRWLRHVQHEDRAREFISVTRVPAVNTPRSLVLEGFRPSQDA